MRFYIMQLNSLILHAHFIESINR